MDERAGSSQDADRSERPEPAAEARNPGPADRPQGPGTTPVSSTAPTWVGIVANKGSGSGLGLRLVGRLCAELEKRGIGSKVAWSPDERRGLVAGSAEDPSCRCLVAVGGDGTVGALLNEKPGLPVAILPAGTENLTAGHFRHRRSPAKLAAAIAEGRARPVDLGEASGRRFMLMAGFGFDGDVVTRHHRGRLGTSGSVRPTNRVAYVEPLLRSSFSYRFPVIHVSVDDPGREELLSGTTVFLFNLPRYALGLPFVPSALDDDGWLDLLVFREPGPFRALYYLWRVVCGNHLDDPGVMHRRIRRVTLRADEPVPVQLDGDPAGFLAPESCGPTPEVSPAVADVDGAPGGPPSGPWRVDILPAAVRMLMPARSRPKAPAPFALARDGRPR